MFDNLPLILKQMSEKNWFVYMIRSDDDQLYTGITTDISRRWQEHSSGKVGARYFRGRKPQTLCLLETHPDRSSASKREAALKQLKRSAKDRLLADQDVDQIATLSKINHTFAAKS